MYTFGHFIRFSKWEHIYVIFPYTSPEIAGFVKTLMDQYRYNERYIIFIATNQTY